MKQETLDKLITHTNQYKHEDFVHRIVVQTNTCQQELSLAFGIAYGHQRDTVINEYIPKNKGNNTNIETLISFIKPFVTTNIQLENLEDPEKVREEAVTYYFHNRSDLKALSFSFGIGTSIAIMFGLDAVDMYYPLEYLSTGLSFSLGLGSILHTAIGFGLDNCKNFLTYKKVHRSVAPEIGRFLRQDYAKHIQEQLQADDPDYKAYKSRLPTPL